MTAKQRRWEIHSAKQAAFLILLRNRCR